eukprot:CAMPEP_0119154980 /NCGR_PEP_ID=MMETSP1310-20130426/51513_1 /TAXON_ID=464262 /ORGANISM="Genus nov. species nov., Strain RCC2339" /LENGTH=288 /DNA_ID=CAMNT_0007147567 /DNA_START=196 /DNA_END=1059 /DNA_ORIENTATION=-
MMEWRSERRRGEPRRRVLVENMENSGEPEEEDVEDEEEDDSIPDYPIFTTEEEKAVLGEEERQEENEEEDNGEELEYIVIPDTVNGGKESRVPSNRGEDSGSPSNGGEDSGSPSNGGEDSGSPSNGGEDSGSPSNGREDSGDSSTRKDETEGPEVDMSNEGDKSGGGDPGEGAIVVEEEPVSLAAINDEQCKEGMVPLVSPPLVTSSCFSPSFSYASLSRTSFHFNSFRTWCWSKEERSGACRQREEKISVGKLSLTLSLPSTLLRITPLLPLLLIIYPTYLTLNQLS